MTSDLSLVREVLGVFLDAVFPFIIIAVDDVSEGMCRIFGEAQVHNIIDCAFMEKRFEVEKFRLCRGGSGMSRACSGCSSIQVRTLDCEK